MDIKTRRFIEERLLTTQELSELLEVPAVTVQQWASRHKVDWVLKGRTYLFDRKDFEDFVRPGTPGTPGRKAKASPSSNVIQPDEVNEGTTEPLTEPIH